MTIKEESLPFSEIVLVPQAASSVEALSTFVSIPSVPQKDWWQGVTPRKVRIASPAVGFILYILTWAKRRLCGILPICFVNTLVRSCKAE